MNKLETPSRLLRRIEANKEYDNDIPSLPSMRFEDETHLSESGPQDDLSQSSMDSEPMQKGQLSRHKLSTPMTSTPMTSSHTRTVTMREQTQFSTSSQTRFAGSIHSNNSMSMKVSQRRGPDISFDASPIKPPLLSKFNDPRIIEADSPEELDSLPEVAQDSFVEDERNTISRSRASSLGENGDQSKLEYEVSVRSEPQAKVTVRRRPTPAKPTARVPSLSRSVSSDSSTSVHMSEASVEASLPSLPSLPNRTPSPMHELTENMENQTALANSRSSGAAGHDTMNSQSRLPSSEQSAERSKSRSSTSSDDIEHLSVPMTSRLARAGSPMPPSSPFPAMATPTPASRSQQNLPVARTVGERVVRVAPTVQNQAPDEVRDVMTPGREKSKFLNDIVLGRPTFQHPSAKPRGTPYPNREAKHPLSQAWVPASPETTETLTERSARSPQPPSHPASTPGSRSARRSTLSQVIPQSPLVEGVSIHSEISVASSHNLLMPGTRDANRSFDPLMARNADREEINRFGLTLNSYLHNLNTRLAKENKGLASQILILKAQLDNQQPDLTILEEEPLDVPPGDLLSVRYDNGELALTYEAQLIEANEKAEALEQDLEHWKAQGEEMAQELAAAKEDLGSAQVEAKENGRQAEFWKSRLEEVAKESDTVLLQMERKMQGEVDKWKSVAEESLKEVEKLEKEVEKVESSAKTSSGEIIERFRGLERAVEERDDLLKQLRAEGDQNRDDFKQAEERAQQLEEELDILKAELLTKQSQLDALCTVLGEKEADVHRLSRENTAATTSKERLEDALSDAAREEEERRAEIAQLQAVIQNFRSEREREQSRSSLRDRSRHSVTSEDIVLQADIAKLEAENEGLWKETKRLRLELESAGGGPAAKALELEHVLQLEELQAQNQELKERISSLVNDRTEHSFKDHTPVLHRRTLALRTPKTPGSPLRDFSWLNTTAHNTEVYQVVQEELRETQERLMKANQAVDEKLQLLEEQAMDGVSLAAQLQEARLRMSDLQAEANRLSSREERRARFLERARCLKCGKKGFLPVQVSDGELLDKLSGEAIDEMVADLSNAAHDTSRANLDFAQAKLKELETELISERSRLKALRAENDILARESDRFKLDLQRAETSKNNLQHELESTRADSRSHSDAVSQLRREVENLENDRKRLEQRISESTKSVAERQQRLSESEGRCRDLRREISSHQQEIDKLREEVQAANTKLDQAQHDRRKNESTDQYWIETFEALTSSVKRVREEIDSCHRELRTLQTEKENLEVNHGRELTQAQRNVSQAQAQSRVLAEQVDRLKRLRDAHKDECRGLVTQIHYLKNKFSRESRLRAELSYSKQYCMGLLRSLDIVYVSFVIADDLI
ncbi:hypothetical protein SISNIDRAFT_452769 [Sistotremastrum niveocremeum HHB9708]|uniref:Pericentrin/AKAP-450 centrosomal targeting domain-containing protein n=1 Tax=Sistotremastrum niveocremeum HHB9708 TaxID=1314777 RepID=A0A164W272_9AGAM|nr:hypothetical protein SISNIDRAFT_452769 [Sistotremastrum niveocremeum HHB9708]